MSMQTFMTAVKSSPATTRPVAKVVPQVATSDRTAIINRGNRHRQEKLQHTQGVLGRSDLFASRPSAALRSVVFQAVASPGHPLDPNTLRLMEQRFRYDFSRVRVHDDHRAAATARLLGAKAFTVGWDIALRPSVVHIDTASGRRTLAHELAHVKQSRGRRPGLSRSITVDERAEREASVAADQVDEGLVVSSPLSHSLGIFCERDPRLGQILEELPFRISLYRRGFPDATADRVAGFLMAYLRNVNLEDRDNRVPVLDVLRAQVGPDVYDRFLDRLENAARASVAAGIVVQQEQIRAMMGVQRTPGLVMPILLRPVMNIAAGTPAFFAGIVEGCTALGADDAGRFVSLLPTIIANAPAVFAGVTVGMDRAIVNQAVGIVQLLDNPLPAVEAILRILMSPNAADLAREIGKHIGTEHVAEFRQMLNSRGVRAAYRFGEILGPFLLTILLIALSFGTARTAQMTSELARIQRPSRLTQLVQRLYQRYPRLELRLPYYRNRIAALGRRVEIAGRRIPHFSNARMVSYLNRLADHPLIRSVRRAYQELRALPPGPSSRLRQVEIIQQLQEEFLTRTGFQLRIATEADVVDLAHPLHLATPEPVVGVQVRTIIDSGQEIRAVLVHPLLPNNPPQHFMELAHDITTFVTQAGGAENPCLVEAMAAYDASQGVSVSRFIGRTHAGRMLDISIFFDRTIEQAVSYMAERANSWVQAFDTLFGVQGPFAFVFPRTPPPLP